MPERLEKLRATVSELEAEMASLPAVDTEAREILDEALREIQSVLDRRPGESLQNPTLSERLADAAERLESSHPTLFGIVRRTIDALGQMGI